MTEDSALGQLIGAYLNQDLFDFYPNVLAAVDDFVADNPGEAEHLIAEINQVLTENPTDDQLETLLDGLGIGFIADPITYREWLTQIADHVRATT